MFDLIYNFIKEVLFNNTVIDSSITDTATMLISIIIIVMFVAILIKLVLWAFNIIAKPFTHR